MNFSSNDTSSLCSKVEGEVVGSSSTGCVCNLAIKKGDDAANQLSQLKCSIIFGQEVVELPLVATNTNYHGQVIFIHSWDAFFFFFF
jgi:hypothetical protein